MFGYRIANYSSLIRTTTNLSSMRLFLHYATFQNEFFIVKNAKIIVLAGSLLF